MSDSSFAGAMLISQQLSFYRWADRWRDNRGASLLAADYGLICQQHGELVGRYNTLVEDFNKLYRLALESEAERKKNANLVSQVMEENSQLVTEREKLQLDLVSVKTELALLRSIDRKQNPEVYRFREE